MDIVIEKTDNGYRQVETYKKNGRKRIRRTNNINRINSLIAALPAKPKFIKIKNKDMKLYYSDYVNIVLKDYENNLDNEIFSIILKGVDENTPKIKNIKVNKSKIAALAFTTVVFVSSVTGFSFNLNHQTPVQNIGKIDPIVYSQIQPKGNILIDNCIVEHSNVDEENFDLEKRIEQTKQILNNEIINNPDIPLATQINNFSLTKLVNFINSEDGKYFMQVAEDFGVDPYTFLSLMMVESSLNHEGTIPGGINYNGFGVGICQLESPNGQKITAFNYSTNQNETICETLENAIDKKMNIKIGIMRYQNVLKSYQGNEKLALQSYNFGPGLVNLIIQLYADEKGITYDEVVNNFDDTGWLKYVEIASNDPVGFASSIDMNKYSNYGQTINYLKNWQYGGYGNPNYLKRIYSYYIGVYSSNVIGDKIIYTNLTDNSAVTVNNSPSMQK